MRTKDKIAADSAKLPVWDGGTRSVVLVAFNGVESIDVAGPASVFAKATELISGSYRVTLATPAGGEIQTNAGFSLAGTQALEQVAIPIDTLIMAGGDELALREAIIDQGVGNWVARVAPSTRRVASVCTGAFALAAAGLLDKREATTHWNACDTLKKLSPQTRVRNDRIYVRDGNVWTSAGVTTGIDLALALVEDDLGHSVAVTIARALALFMVRGDSDPQLSPTLLAQADASKRVRDLLAWIAGNLAENLSVDLMAARATMSPRNFSRTFTEEIGVTPARYVAKARLDQATAFLAQTSWPQAKVAQRSGFNSPDAMQRAFFSEFGITPAKYRFTTQRRVSGT